MEPRNLEQMLLQGRPLKLAEGALLASGVRDERAFTTCLTGIEHLSRHVASAVEGDDEDRARGLFLWLSESTPRRWQRGGSYRLSDVVDAQLGGRAGVGNCLGLTLLYNVLAQEMGLRVTAVHLEDAFAAGPHVFTVLRTKERSFDIEHMFPSGFDFPGHRDSPGRDDWGDRELIADVYHSRGCDHAERHEWKDAADCYRKALQLNPRYVRARLNTGIALVELDHVDEARTWFQSLRSRPAADA
ncbi:MAG: tetratricopeptide repeat protein [Chloroflexota bacterium]|nr:tetratricopeptide repeat protein [Chloroflexota bacterium]